MSFSTLYFDAENPNMKCFENSMSKWPWQFSYLFEYFYYLGTLHLTRQQNFHDFWPLPPYRRQFFTTIRRQIWQIFDPSPPKKCRRLKWMVPLIVSCKLGLMQSSWNLNCALCVVCITVCHERITTLSTHVQYEWPHHRHGTALTLIIIQHGNVSDSFAKQQQAHGEASRRRRTEPGVTAPYIRRRRCGGGGGVVEDR